MNVQLLFIQNIKLPKCEKKQELFQRKHTNRIEVDFNNEKYNDLL